MSIETSSAPSFAVVTDSSSDLGVKIAADSGVTVVPLTVNFGDESFTDGDLTQAEFFARMDASPELPTTSLPPIGVFVDAYERALKTADEVISVHVSSRLSGTIESARKAAEEFSGRVHVFDSLNLSWGCGLQVLDATKAAREGMTPTAALERLARTRDRVKIIVGVDSLTNLAKGGRIGRVSSFLGAMLDLKVTFTVGPDGAFVPVHRARGEKKALSQTLKWVEEQMGESKSGIFAIGQAMTLPRAERLRDAITQRYEALEMYIYETGSVISTHTGTGWGIIFLPSEVK
ncbi:MAG: DegV family protein [Actinomycetota bacterium]|nr:DegV family protein [Actinomycetota bacterium]